MILHVRKSSLHVFGQQQFGLRRRRPVRNADRSEGRSEVLLRRPRRRKSGAEQGIRERRQRGLRRPWLKGSIGEGSNLSTFSDQSSVRILGIRILSELRRFCWNLSEILAKFPYRRNSEQISSKSARNSMIFC